MLQRARIFALCPPAIRRVLPVVVLLAACSLSAFAKKQGSGDFNGDGYADLCIGVPTYTIGAETAAGAVNCLYGSASGLQATGVPVAAQLWTQDTDGVQGVPEKNDNFGFALASGDFNGDGFDDLCVGIPNESVSGDKGAGAVNCIYGSSTGLTVTGTGGPKPQIWDKNNTGLNAGGEMGWALVAGDFNHDGYADLCIGLPNHSVSGVKLAGEVNCLYGSASGLTSSGAQVWSQNSAGGGGTAEGSDFFGQANREVIEGSGQSSLIASFPVYFCRFFVAGLRFSQLALLLARRRR